MSESSKSEETLWYVHHSGNRLGPYHWEQVVKYHSDLGSPPDFQVWNATMAAWLPMGEVVGDTAPVPDADEGGVQEVDAGAIESLHVSLAGTRKVDPNAPAHHLAVKSKSTAASPTSSPKQASLPMAVQKGPENNQGEADATAKPIVSPASSTPASERAADEGMQGWLGVPEGDGVNKAAPEVSEVEKSLAQELDFSTPRIKQAPPLGMTILLILACAGTAFWHKPAYEMSAISTPFSLSCWYSVEAGGRVSIMKRMKIKVAGKRFRTDTPQMSQDVAIYDGSLLTLYKKKKKRKRGAPKYTSKIIENPNPILLEEVMMWRPLVNGVPPAGGGRVAKRPTLRFQKAERMGQRMIDTVELVDAKGGMVLRRIVRKTQGGKVIEKTQFKCTKAVMGPVSLKVFKEP